MVLQVCSFKKAVTYLKLDAQIAPFKEKIASNAFFHPQQSEKGSLRVRVALDLILWGGGWNSHKIWVKNNCISIQKSHFLNRDFDYF